MVACMSGVPNEVRHDLLSRYQFYVAFLTVLTVQDPNDIWFGCSLLLSIPMHRPGFRKICMALVNDRSLEDEWKLQN